MGGAVPTTVTAAGAGITGAAAASFGSNVLAVGTGAASAVGLVPPQILLVCSRNCCCRNEHSKPRVVDPVFSRMCRFVHTAKPLLNTRNGLAMDSRVVSPWL